MKFFTKKSTVQKIILALVVIILFNFAIPVQSRANIFGDMGGKLLSEIIKLVDSVGDVIMGLLNKTMLGTDEIYSSVILDKDDPSVITEGAVAYSNGNEKGTRKEEIAGKFDNGLFSGGWKVPNMLYCPENIFANKIRALDVNFIHPNKYTDVYGNERESFANKLSPTISSWYKAFRNIAVVGLLCVLVYLGIRMLLETSAQGKAQYKEALWNWFVALCLVFAIHFIMAFTLMIIDNVTSLLTNSLGDSAIYVDVVEGTAKRSFKTNLTGYMRFLAQSNNWGDTTAYTIIYVVLVIYTVMFTFTYLKRFLWMAFLTMIAPLVSLTYPIDKAGDGKAQAFNMWFKEYIMNAILQPVHLLLYSVMVSSAMDLASENPIYALAAIGFLIPAEKFIKKLFGLDKGQTAGGLGSFAGGAMTMKALESLGKKAPPPLDNGKKDSKNESESNRNQIRVKTRKSLESFQNGENTTPESSIDDGNQQSDGQPRTLDNNGENDENGAGENNSLDSSNTNPIEPPLDNGNSPESPEDNTIHNNTQPIDQDTNNLDANNTLIDQDTNNNNAPIDQDANNNNTPIEQGTNNNSDDNQNNYRPSNARAVQLAPLGGPRNSVKRALFNTAIRGASTLPKHGKYWAKKGLRAGFKGAGTMAGAVVGIGAGLATGDASKVFQYGIAGAAAGNKIGGGAFNGVYNGANAIKDFALESTDKMKNAYEEERYTPSQARANRIFEQNQRSKKEFMKNDEEKRKYKEIVAKIQEDGGNCTLEQAMSAAFDYKVAGLDDDKIAKGLELEGKHGGVGGRNHDQMMDIMNLTGSYSGDYILDEKKRESLEGVVASKVPNKFQQRQVMDLFAEAYGYSDYYNKVKSRRSTNRNSQNNRNANRNSPNTGNTNGQAS